MADYHPLLSGKMADSALSSGVIRSCTSTAEDIKWEGRNADVMDSTVAAMATETQHYKYYFIHLIILTYIDQPKHKTYSLMMSCQTYHLFK